ncbi:type IV toxin-antitoxin system AbiEi family antitoxin domain-containing protein [Nocardioides panacisoli]|uniref:type IV toxin-antitoxin system AbiEi family antitoxin domain-containing protein n=1 Tax=Nocardioides panacisoli TaxID=627624 RepID=UPI001C62FE3F|nr:type IV toxin-antitoxin system AbiEi family antitoxin domain-containing protein [Nocardioides panacisoli]QYJ03976.1 type IV toxin-antitoxin system AbiEi family antitoxin domain-containing protein [Nocardioides panacisoli]
MDPRLEDLCLRHGVFLRREALAIGYSDKAIDRHVRDGAWCRVRRGAYVDGETWRTAARDERYRLHVLAAMRQSRTPVVASHVSAVALHGGPLWGLDLRHAHLTRRDARTGRKEAGVEQHRGRLEDGDVVEVDQRAVMSATRTALEVSTVSDVEAALCVVDDFLRRGLTTLTALQQRYDAMAEWPCTLHTPIVLRLASPLRESVGETRLFHLCWRHHLPAPVPQVEIHDADGVLVARVDFAWPELGVFAEFDGREKYRRFRRPGESLEDFIVREKQREDRVREITGWRCIRVTWRDLRDPERLARRIRGLMTAAA